MADNTNLVRQAGKRFRAVVAGLVASLVFLGPALADLPRIKLRFGEHPTFSRLVFDWPETVPYEVKTEDERIEIRFGKVADLDPSGFKGDRAKRITSHSVENGDTLTISLGKAAGKTVRHFRDGKNIVIDVIDARPETKQAAEAPKAAGKAAEQLPANPAGKVADKPEARVTAQPEPAKSGKTATPLKYSGAPLKVLYEPVFNGARLTYSLDVPSPAAIFERSDYLWVVFDKYRAMDESGIKDILGERILSAEQIPHPLATVIRYQLRRGQHVQAHRRDNTWIVELRDNRTAPQIPIDIAQQSADKGANIFLPLNDTGVRIDFVDPAVGDPLIVVPSAAPGRGLVDTRRFVQFNLLKTAQGVVVEPLADSLEVERYKNGVAIASSQGLMVSKGALATITAKEGSADPVLVPARLVDLAAWRLGEPAEFQKHKQKLLQRLSMASAKEKNSVRWDLARFYLGHDMADQAVGILAVMAQGDENLLENPEFRAARGIANTMLRRFAEARNDFAHPSLDTETDAYLWRSLIAEGLGDHEKALEFYRRGLDALNAYTEGDRVRFKLAAIRSAIDLGQTDFAGDELAVASRYLVSPRVAAEIDYLRNKILAATGDPETAKEGFKAVAQSSNRESAARANLARTLLMLEDQSLSTTDAIDQLERLRYAWRGDGLELELLERLGRLYMESGDYRSGLLTLRQAVTYFDNSPRTREISEVMAEAFRELFLNGAADSLPPVQALSLYYDFRELTPLGADGDNMIRRLADRLVSIDLLDRAGELLEHQVRFRLEGVAQATVASRLAMIYLMDQKPENALAVIRATRQAVMPEDVERRRRHLEVRGLIDLKRFEEAEILLEGEKGRDAELLRADLYWGATRWTDVVRNGLGLLGNRWRDDAPLSDDERRQVLRIAVAMSMADDVDGLRQLREQYSVLMAEGAYAGAFDVITAKHDPSSNEIKELTESIASVAKLESFMASYRQEFRGS